MLKVRLLGQFSIQINGRSVELPSRPAQSLFAYLMLNRRVEHRRERLAGMLWPESTEASARNNLRQALWRIRRALGHEADALLDADRFQISINPDADFWLDVRALETELPADASSDEWIQSCSEYAGELLPGFYDDWMVMERERIGQLMQRRFQETLEHLAREARWAEQLELAERWIGFGGVPEAAFRAAIEAHFQLGDSGRAVAAYERLKVALADDQVSPSEQTERLMERVKSGEKGSAVSPKPSASPTPGFVNGRIQERERSPLFAREAELERLDGLLQKSLEDGGRIVLVTGEAGSGKTALLREFSHRAHHRHKQLLIAKGDSNALTGPGDPYLPFRGVLECLIGDIEASWERGVLTTAEAQRAWDALPTSCRALLSVGEGLVGGMLSTQWLTSVVPGHASIPPALIDRIRALSAIERADRLGPELSQSGMFKRVAELLISLADEYPLLIALDDLQWADVGSIDLAFYLARRIADSPILILGAYRPEELAYQRNGQPHPLNRLLAELQRTQGDLEIDLSHSSDLPFVEALIDSEPNLLPDSFRQMLHKQTRGNPLFTIELLRAMQGRGDLVADSQGRWEPGPSLDWKSLPVQVEGVLAERLSRVEAELKELLDVASVEGEDFTAELVAAVLNREPREVIHSLSQQLDKLHRLVEAHSVTWIDGRRLSRYRFRHILFQRQLYEKLDPVERSFLHAQVGTTLESMYGAEVDRIAVQLAHHYAEAGDVIKSIHYLRAAGEYARRISANAEAVAYLEHALKLLPDFPAGPARIENELAIQIALGAARIASEGYASPRVQAAYARAHELCFELEGTPQRFPALWGLWSFNTVQAAHGSAKELAVQLQQLADEDHGLQLESYRALGTTLFYLGQIREARSQLEHGIELYHPAQHADHAYLYGQNPLVSSLINLALVLWLLGYPDRAQQEMATAVSQAHQIAHPHSLSYALLMAASLHSSLRQWGRTVARAEEAIEVAEDYGFPLWLAASTILRGAALAQQGQKQSVEVIRTGLEEWERLGAGLGLPHYLGLLAKTLASSDQAERGLQQVERAIQIAHDHQELVHLAELHRIQGDLLLQLGRPSEQVQSAFKQSAASAKEMRSPSMELRAVIGLSRFRMSQGHRHTHKDMLSKTLSRFDEGFETPDLLEANELLEG